MNKADTGKTVRVHYRGILDNGEEFDSTHKRGEPMEFTIGVDQMIPAFSEAVIGMSSGESKCVQIPAEEAYGPHREEMIRDFDRQQLPADIELVEGMVLSAYSADGKKVLFKVVSFDESNVRMDANHPLAGQSLTFEIQLIEVL
jgi:FKBP-type peptidyl-prolyl cis-trans isomerase 2